MDKYLQMCDYIESHLNEMRNPEYARRIITEYRLGKNTLGKPISDEKCHSRIPSELQSYHLSLSDQFSYLIKKNKDYEAYKKIYGKRYYLDPQGKNVWTKRVMSRKIFKKNGDFESINVSFFFPHFRSNDDIVRKKHRLNERKCNQRGF